MSKVHISDSGCWEFRRNKRPDGYGLIWRDGRSVRAHRVSYELFKGPLQDTDCILHQCDNRSCVNPDHLSIGNRADNMRDTVKRRRLCYGEKHHGAKLTSEQVRKIRSDTRTHAVIAAEHGVTASVISRIKSGLARAVAD